jgi:hypothetical protein
MSTSTLVAQDTWERVKRSDIVRSAIAGASYDYSDADELCKQFFVGLMSGSEARGLVASPLINSPRMFALRGVIGDDAAQAAIAAAYMTARYAPQLADCAPEDLEENLAALMGIGKPEKGEPDSHGDGKTVAAEDGGEEDADGAEGDGDDDDSEGDEPTDEDAEGDLLEEDENGEPITVPAEVIDEEADAALGRMLAVLGEKLENVDEALAMLVPDFDDPFKPTPVSLSDRLALAGVLGTSSELQNIIKMCGRLRRLQYGKASDGIDPNDVSGVVLGNTIPKLVASEYGAMVLPELRADFYSRYANEQLLMKRPGLHAPMGQGPIIVCLDSSGSMGYGLNGRRIGDGGDLSRKDLSKAIALAALHQAAEERRDIAIIAFGEIEETRVWHFEKGEADMADLLDCMSYFACAGREDYGHLMKTILELAEDSRYDKADALLVGDAIKGAAIGLNRMPIAHWNELRAKRGMRAFAILLGDEAQNMFDGMCDEVTRISSLTDLDRLTNALNV